MTASVLRFVAVLFLVSSVLLGCSGGKEEPDRGAAPEAGDQGSGVALGMGDADGESGQGRGHVVIESASLGTAGDTGLIAARVSYGGPGVWPDCSLIDGPTMEAAREGKLPRGARFVSRWAKPDSGEKELLDDGTLLWTFQEEPGAKAPDPERTPYFVFCTGSGGPANYVEARVAGTAEAPS